MADSTATPAFDETGLEGLYGLTDVVIRGPLLAAVEAGVGKAVGWFVSALHPADLIGCLPITQCNALETLLGDDLDPDVVTYLNASLRHDH
ncbi:MAG: hypothetical protein ACKVG6_05440 [Alphaproteobacteria bacterium]|jgi:hypothetical protein